MIWFILFGLIDSSNAGIWDEVLDNRTVKVVLNGKGIDSPRVSEKPVELKKTPTRDTLISYLGGSDYVLEVQKDQNGEVTRVNDTWFTAFAAKENYSSLNSAVMVKGRVESFIFCRRSGVVGFWKREVDSDCLLLNPNSCARIANALQVEGLRWDNVKIGNYDAEKMDHALGRLASNLSQDASYQSLLNAESQKIAAFADRSIPKQARYFHVRAVSNLNQQSILFEPRPKETPTSKELPERNAGGIMLAPTQAGKPSRFQTVEKAVNKCSALELYQPSKPAPARGSGRTTR